MRWYKSTKNLYFFVKNKGHSMARMSFLRYNRCVNRYAIFMGEQLDEKKDSYALQYLA